MNHVANTVAANANSRSRRFDEGDFGEDYKTAWTLPSFWYTDPAVFAAEKENIFFRSWRFACHKNDLPKAGDYMTLNILEEPIFVIRGKDMVLRAFFNVCQHRAHTLLEGRGNAKHAIVCPYHAWSYTPEGNFRKAPQSEYVTDFDPHAYNLKEVRLQEFGSFIFVNVDENAPPLEAFAPGYLESMTGHFKDLEKVAYAEEQVYEIDANWKVVVENALEGYHFPYSGEYHKSLTNLVDASKGETNVHENWIELYAPRGDLEKAPYTLPADENEGTTSAFVTLFLSPDCLIYNWPNMSMVSVFLVVPEGPEKSRVENKYYFVPGEGNDKTTLEGMDWFNHGLGPEDAALNLGCQAGLRSRGYRAGRFMYHPENSGLGEHGVHYFQKLVRNAVNGPPV